MGLYCTCFMKTPSNGNIFRVCAGKSPVTVNSPHKGQWRGALVFSLICAQTYGWRVIIWTNKCTVYWRINASLGLSEFTHLTHWPLGDLNVILKMYVSILFSWLVSSNFLMIMSSDDRHRTSLMISQHWFRQLFGAVRQQAITWTSVDQNLQRIWRH